LQGRRCQYLALLSAYTIDLTTCLASKLADIDLQSSNRADPLRDQQPFRLSAKTAVADNSRRIDVGGTE